jgi:molybdopterin-guanine dinucleotide biosynthesis protein B
LGRGRIEVTLDPAASGVQYTSGAMGLRDESPPGVDRPPAQPALVAIVGRSDSGKTTLIESLLPELKLLGLRVGTIKHDVHGFEIDTPGKDSWRHGRAGADMYAIAGPDKLAYVRALSRELPLTDIARRYFADVDLVVAEGYKRVAPHCIEIFRRAAGHAEPLCGPGESLALVTDATIEHPHRFALDDARALAAFIQARLARLRDYLGPVRE